MALTHFVAAAEHTRDLPASPYVIGLISLVLLLSLLVGVWMFGKGRPHS